MSDTAADQSNIEIRDPAFRTVVGDTVAIEQIATGFLFTEGPLWHAREKYLLFSDMPGDHMRKWTARGGVTTFRKPCAQSNGLTWDRQGRLLVCEHATSKVTRTEADGSSTVIASHHDGKELNSPNDIVVKSDGGIYFSGPDLRPQRVLRQSAPAAARLPRRLPGRAGGRQAHAAGGRFRPAERALLLARREAAVRQRHRPPAHPRVRRAARTGRLRTAGSGRRRRAKGRARRTE